MKTKNVLLVPGLMTRLGVHLSYMHRAMRSAVCALWVLTTASCAYSAVSFTSLGFLPGDNYSFATGVSGDGSVVVGTSGLQPYVGTGYYRAFRWTAGSGMVGLGHLLGDTYSQADRVSADGSVVVGISSSTYLGPAQTFRWTAA